MLLFVSIYHLHKNKDLLVVRRSWACRVACVKQSTILFHFFNPFSNFIFFTMLRWRNISTRLHRIALAINNGEECRLILPWQWGIIQLQSFLTILFDTFPFAVTKSDIHQSVKDPRATHDSLRISYTIPLFQTNSRTCFQSHYLYISNTWMENIREKTQFWMKELNTELTYQGENIHDKKIVPCIRHGRLHNWFKAPIP